MKEILGFIGGIILVIVLILAIDYTGLMWNSFIGPKRENVRREIFEETKSYNQGMKQDLVKYLHEYNMSKDPEEKKAISATVRHQMSDYNEMKLSPELRSFLTRCRSEQDGYGH